MTFGDRWICQSRTIKPDKGKQIVCVLLASSLVIKLTYLCQVVHSFAIWMGLFCPNTSSQLFPTAVFAPYRIRAAIEVAGWDVESKVLK